MKWVGIGVGIPLNNKMLAKWLSSIVRYGLISFELRFWVSMIELCLESYVVEFCICICLCVWDVCEKGGYGEQCQ